MSRRRVGIYGGTFNPIHRGHLRAAEAVSEQLALSRVIFVPSGRPPHKADDDPAGPIAEAALRLGWVRDAVASNPRFEVSPLEVEREGPSYLVDTLAALRDQWAGERLVFVLGCDAFADLGDWREPRRLLTLADFAVMTRPPDDGTHLGHWLPDCVRGDVDLAADGRVATHREADTRIELVEICALDVSATDVRARARAGESLRDLVPESVCEAVEQSGVYAGETPALREVK